ncbi:DegT/DnrJ/EryC1/StrS family aminotransferase [Alphaproteobacteria bacterium]|nr:DegT/DnrJ/EryC1/StrS family aminotransferase [Alphaproteobacteria bacterium]
MIQLSKLNYSEAENDAVMRVMESGWLTMGAEVQAFEKEFSQQLLNNTDCIAVSSCTAALHMALILSGVGAGDDVLVSGLTFVAAANMVLAVGGNPVFADSKNLTDWNSGIEEIKAAITPNTKAVVITHFAGWPASTIEDICAYCTSKGIRVIEDCAHAPGATINSQFCGTFGDFSCFSFFSNKNIATGEGGMLAVRDKSEFERSKGLRSHGMTTLTLDRHQGRAFSYDVTEPGYNYRIDEIRGALGRVQLMKLEKDTQRRKDIFDLYVSNLSESGIKIPFQGVNGATSTYHIMPVLLPNGTDRQAIMSVMREKEIQTSIHYPAFSTFLAYQGRISEDNKPAVCEDISERELTLPMHAMLSDQDVLEITSALQELI